MESFLGSSMDVLYEEACSNKEGYYEGYTPNYIKVIAESSEDIKGEIISTKLLTIEGEAVIGKK